MIWIPGHHRFIPRQIKKTLHEVKTLNLPLCSASFSPPLLTEPPIAAACRFLEAVIPPPEQAASLRASSCWVLRAPALVHRSL